MSIFSFFRKSKPPTSGYYDYLLKKDNNINVLMQQSEDEKIERRIKHEAKMMMMARQYEQIYITNPLDLSYIVYDIDSAKYADADIMGLVREEYNKLKVTTKEEEVWH